MSRNGKLEPMEVETMMNEARMLNNIIEVGERMIVSDKMEEARSNMMEEKRQLSALIHCLSMYQTGKEN